MNKESAPDYIYWEKQEQKLLPPRQEIRTWGGGSGYCIVSVPNDGWVLWSDQRRARKKLKRDQKKRRKMRFLQEGQDDRVVGDTQKFQ